MNPHELVTYRRDVDGVAAIVDNGLSRYVFGPTNEVNLWRIPELVAELGDSGAFGPAFRFVRLHLLAEITDNPTPGTRGVESVLVTAHLQGHPSGESLPLAGTEAELAVLPDAHHDVRGVLDLIDWVAQELREIVARAVTTRSVLDLDDAAGTEVCGSPVAWDGVDTITERCTEPAGHNKGGCRDAA